MSTELDAKKTLSEELSEIAVSKLVGSGLLLEADNKYAVTAMSKGQLKSEDWRLLIEKAIDKEV